jgi:hypothetical protein
MMFVGGADILERMEAMSGLEHTRVSLGVLLCPINVALLGGAYIQEVS